MLRDNNHSYNRAQIEEIIQWVTNHTLPATADTYLKQYRFKSQAAEFTVRKINNLDSLFYQNRQVIASEDVADLLTKTYSKASTRINGRDRLFKTLAVKYYGVTKTAVSRFLNAQELHQVHIIPTKAKDIIPIVPKYPYQHWQMDLIVISEKKESAEGTTLTAFTGNSGYKYVLTCIDTFTKYVHTVPLKDRKSAVVAQALQEILDLEMETDIHHCLRILQSDNEFDTAEFKQLCAKYDIKQVFSKSHVSSSGAIERFNRTLKSAIWQNFTATKSKLWLSVLPKVTKCYNDTYHTVIKAIPSALHPILGNVSVHSINVTKGNLQESAQSKIIAATHFPKLLKNSTVRIVLAGIDASIRQQIKSGHAKGYTEKWSREVYTVKSISRPKSEFIQPRY